MMASRGSLTVAQVRCCRDDVCGGVIVLLPARLGFGILVSASIALELLASFYVAPR
jgi:hypothetical protein